MSTIPRKAGIYRIDGPNDGIYIGSAIDIAARWNTHQWNLKRGTHHNKHLQRAWSLHGAEAFTISVIEIVDSSSDLLVREQLYLDLLFRGAYTNIYNHAPIAGSGKGIPASAERKRKIGIANSGKRASAETRKKLSEAHKGYKPSVAAIAKTAAANKGRVFSQETRARIGAANMGRQNPPESVRRASEKNRGRKHNDATKQRMSLAHQGRIASSEERNRIALGKAKGAMYTIHSPMGVEYRHVVNLTAFALEHGINRATLQRIATNGKATRTGWRAIREE
jgi:group I intron endonuclease